MTQQYAWNTHDTNSLAHHYQDKQIISGFSTKNNIGYKGWAHVVILYDTTTNQYLPVKTQGGINETPWHENTLTYGHVTQDKNTTITSLQQLMETDPYHYNSAQIIDCIQTLFKHNPA